MDVVVILSIVVIFLLTVGFFMVYGALANGFVLTKLWGWFIVPVFGLPQLSLPYAIGFAMIIGYLTRHDFKIKDDSEEKDVKTAWVKVIVSILYPWLALFLGWVVHLFC